MRFMTDVSLRIYVPADHICTWRLINFDLFIGPCSSPFRGAAAPFWSFKRGSVWILMQFNSMMWAFFFFLSPRKLKRQNDATKRKLCTHCWPGRKCACFGESNYNQKENVLFHADCRKSLSFPFHIVIFCFACCRAVILVWSNYWRGIMMVSSPVAVMSCRSLRTVMSSMERRTTRG